MSETPRTDAIHVDAIGDSDGAMDAMTLCCQLERELAEATRRLSEAERGIDILNRRIADYEDANRRAYLNGLESGAKSQREYAERCIEALRLAKVWIEIEEDDTFENVLKVEGSFNERGKIGYNQDFIAAVRAIDALLRDVPQMSVTPTSGEASTDAPKCQGSLNADEMATVARMAAVSAEVNQKSGPKKYADLRARTMSPESQARAAAKTQELLAQSEVPVTFRAQPELPEEYPAFSKWFTNLDPALYDTGPEDHDAAWLGWQARAVLSAPLATGTEQTWVCWSCGAQSHESERPMRCFNCKAAFPQPATPAQGG